MLLIIIGAIIVIPIIGWLVYVAAKDE